MEQRQIVIVGGGFAGVWAALGAAAVVHDQHAQSSVRTVLVSPDDWLVVRPRLYESDLRGVRVPLASVLSPVGVEHRRALVEGIDPDRRVLALGGECPGELRYDQLVLCTGSRVPLPGRAGEVHCVDTYEQALALHRAIAALAADPGHGLNVAVVGGGFTGIEIAAELADVLRRLADRPGVDAGQPRVRLIDQAPSPAPQFGAAARGIIAGALSDLGVEVLTGAHVSDVAAHEVSLADGRHFHSELVVWAAGPRASGLNQQLGTELDPLGRVVVDTHLATGVDGVWAAGDTAGVTADGDHAALMSCQHAMPQGRQAGENAAAALLGRAPRRYCQPLYLTCLDLASAGALLTCGFARDHVLATGAQAKRFKRFINRSVIYPPPGGNAAELLKVGRTAPPGRAAAAIERLALRSEAVQNLVTTRAEDRAEHHAAEGFALV